MLWKSLVSEFRRLRAERRFSELPQRPVDIERRVWHHADVEWMAGLAEGIPGDFSEIGVFNGAAFRKLVQLARAFDSFSGTAEPGVQDGNQYAKGGDTRAR